MKKKSKVFLLLSVLTLAIGSAVVGSIKWNEKIELSSAEATQVLENEGITIRTVDTSKFKENTEKESVTEEPNLPIEAPKSNQQQTKPDQGEVPTEAKQDPQVSVEQQQPADETKSLSVLKQDYMLKFLALETEISGTLTTILDKVVAEYEAEKSEAQFDLRKFQNKYVTEVIQLEQKADQQFNMLYKQLEADLLLYGYDKNEAIPYRAQYQAEKQNREQKAVQRVSNLK